jgi:hypothetical protein
VVNDNPVAREKTAARRVLRQRWLVLFIMDLGPVLARDLLSKQWLCQVGKKIPGAFSDTGEMTSKNSMDRVDQERVLVWKSG